MTYILEPLPLTGTIFAQGGSNGDTSGTEPECWMFVEIKPERPDRDGLDVSNGLIRWKRQTRRRAKMRFKKRKKLRWEVMEQLSRRGGGGSS